MRKERPVRTMSNRRKTRIRMPATYPDLYRLSRYPLRAGLARTRTLFDQEFCTRGRGRDAMAPNPLKWEVRLEPLRGRSECLLFVQTVTQAHRTAKEPSSELPKILQLKICGALFQATDCYSGRYVNASFAKIHPRASPLRRHVPWPRRWLRPRRRARPHAATRQLVGHLHRRGHCGGRCYVKWRQSWRR